MAIFAIMRTQKGCILFLLFVYLIGLVHNLAPHVDTFSPGKQRSHLHAHHDHPSDRTFRNDHSHIAHRDHYDAGLYDLLLCFLNESEHSGGDCHSAHERLFKTSDRDNELPAPSRIVPERFFAILRPVPTLEKGPFEPSEPSCLPPLAKAISHRGPPVPSC